MIGLITIPAPFPAAVVPGVEPLNVATVFVLISPVDRISSAVGPLTSNLP